MSDVPRRKPPWLWFILALVLISCCSPLWLSMIHVFHSARVAAYHSQRYAQARQLEGGLLQYALAHQGRLPSLKDPAKLTRELSPYCALPNLGALIAGCQWNQKLSGVKIGSISDPQTAWVLWWKSPDIFEDIVGFADGHVKSCPPEYVQKLIRQ